MTAVHQALLAVAIPWALLLVAGFLVAAVRGARLLDRLVAVDAVGLCLAAALALLALRESEAGYLDAALGIALLAFVGTLAVARFREHGGSF